MSEPVDYNPTSPAKQDGDAAQRSIAQVEKWMTMIREMSREETEAPHASGGAQHLADRYRINRLRSVFLARSPTCLCT